MVNLSLNIKNMPLNQTVTALKYRLNYYKFRCHKHNYRTNNQDILMHFTDAYFLDIMICHHILLLVST